MIHVNLLPPQYRPIKRTPLPHILSVLVLLGALATMAFMFLQIRGQISSTELRLTETEADIADLSGIIAEYERLKQQEAQMRAKVAVIQEILLDRIIWSREISYLLELMPDNIWLEQVWVSYQEDRQEQIVRDEQGEIVRDPRTGREKTEVVTTREYRLNVRGYASQDEEGGKDVNTFIERTQNDPEFSKVFDFIQSPAEDSIYNGRPVREFTLLYAIDPAGRAEPPENDTKTETEETAR